MTMPVTCPGIETCDPGAVGCLYFENYETTEDDYIDVKPVELAWDDEIGLSSETIPVHSARAFDDKDSGEDSTDDNGFECVYKHLNDENFRYCSMIHAKRNTDRCYYGIGHKICCCYVGPDKTTCDPRALRNDLNMQVSTTTTSNTTTSLTFSSDQQLLPIDTTKAITTTLPLTTTLPITTTNAMTTLPITTTATVNLSSTTTTIPTLTITQKTRCHTVIIPESRFASKPNRRPKSRKEIVCNNVTDSSKSILSIRFLVLLPWSLIHYVLSRYL